MKEIDLTIFPKDREEKLKSIYRYSMFDTMFYRSNLWMHAHRILWMLEELAPAIRETLPSLDIEKARIFALVHDDAEMITGDVQLGRKERMSKEELETVEANELAAINELASRYPETVHGYAYKELLLHALHKDCIEAQLVSYLDKLDAYCESIHEVFAGNISLLRAVLAYRILENFPTKFPDLVPLLKSKRSSLVALGEYASPYDIKAEAYEYLHAPHTKESIAIPTDFLFYNVWRKLVVARTPDGVEWLTKQKEFLK